MSTMTIGDVIIAEARASQRIAEILVALETETGLSVADVRVDTSDATRLGDARRRTMITGVRVKLDLP